MLSAHSYIGPTFSKKVCYDATMLIGFYIHFASGTKHEHLFDQDLPNGWSIIFDIRPISGPPKVAPGARAPLCPPLTTLYATEQHDELASLDKDKYLHRTPK